MRRSEKLTNKVALCGCLVVFCLALGSSQVCVGQRTQQQKKTEPWQELTGNWQCEGAWVQGKSMPKEVIAKTQLQMGKGTFVAQTMVGRQTGSLSFVGDPSKRQLKISTTVPPKKPEDKPTTSTMNCMYKLEGGRLVIVYSVDEKFPTEFKSTEKNGYLLIHYRKVIAKKADSKKKR